MDPLNYIRSLQLRKVMWQESLELEDMMTEERRKRDKVVKEQQVIEDEAKRMKIRNVESLLFLKRRGEYIIGCKIEEKSPNQKILFCI